MPNPSATANSILQYILTLQNDVRTMQKFLSGKFPGMSTDFDLDGGDILDVNQAAVDELVLTALTSFPATSPTGTLTVFSDGIDLKSVDSLATANTYLTVAAASSTYLPLAGGTMTGDIAMGTNDLLNVGDLSGAANTRTADNIVSNAGASVDTRVASFSGVSGKVIQDSGILTANVFLADGTVPATGDFAMGTHDITNLTKITCTTVDTVLGKTPTFNAGGTVIAIGNAPVASGTFDIAIGNGATCTVDNAIALGNGTSNTIANTCLIGDAAIANIRANSLICDLGTSARPFKACWLRDSAPASNCHYSMYTSATLANSGAETSLLTGSSVGTLAWSATQSIGTIIRFIGNYTISSLATDTLTLRFKVNGLIVVITTRGTAALVGQAGVIKIDFVLQAATVQSSVELQQNGISPAISTANAAYDSAIINTFSLTGQWTGVGVPDVADSFTLDTARFETLFAT